MSESKITSKDIVTEVKRLANERPDFVYRNQPERLDDDPQCYYNGANYVGQGEGCIVGQAMRNLGAPVPREVEGSSASVVLMKMFDSSSANITDLMFLDDIQSEQDMGASWGHAVEFVKESYGQD